MTQTDTAPQVPTTITRLNNLEPNREFCYYRGNLELDIHHARDGAPTYADLLELIKTTARQLSLQKRIKLTERAITPTKIGSHQFEYIAIGIL